MRLRTKLHRGNGHGGFRADGRPDSSGAYTGGAIPAGISGSFEILQWTRRWERPVIKDETVYALLNDDRSLARPTLSTTSRCRRMAHMLTLGIMKRLRA